MSPLVRAGVRTCLLLAASALVLAACLSKPVISSQVAPEIDLTKYRTYAFMDRLSTDSAGYTSITTQLLKQAVDREMAARGLTPSGEPEVLINLLATNKDRIEGDRDPRIGVTYGHWGWGRRGWGAGVGIGDEIRSVREDTITIDLVEKARNVLVWSGSATFRPTKADRNDQEPRINEVVAKIFDRYPQPVVKAAARSP